MRWSWVEIDIDKIKSNFLKVKSLLKPETKIIAVVKANAYGHGAPVIANAMEKLGANMFAVVTLGEALDLKLCAIKTPILVMGHIPLEGAELAVENEFRVALFQKSLLKALILSSKKLKKKAYVHIKVDTGLTRWGLFPSDVLPFMKEVAEYPEIEVEGIYSHFATADEAQKDYTYKQYEVFMNLVGQLTSSGFNIPLKHIANAGATVDTPETHLDAIRPGIILYGYEPSKEIWNPLGVEPALQLKAKVGRAAWIESQTPVSYSRTWSAKEKSLIATLPIGYADGYRRELSNKSEVLLNGQRTRVVGRVNMDAIMVDATPAGDVKEGDEAVLIGKQGNEAIWADEIGSLVGTNSNEVLAGLSLRLPRIYFEDGKILKIISPSGSYYNP